MKGYGVANNRSYRYVVVVIDNSSKYGWIVPLQIENGRTITKSFENILMPSKRKPKLNETDRGKAFHENFFQKFFNKSDIKIYSENKFLGVAFAERLQIVLSKIFLKTCF